MEQTNTPTPEQPVTSTPAPVTPAAPVTPIVSAAPVTPAAPAAPVAPKRVFDPKDVEENKVVAALSYLFILFLVPLLLKRDSPFAQFHAKQGLVFAIIFCVGSFFFWIPLFGWAAFVFLMVVDVMALIKTLGGEAWEVPVVKDGVKMLNI